MLFLHIALQLLRKGGVQIFICSNTWLDVGFGIKLQQFLLGNTTIMKIMDSAVERQFSSADVNTIMSFIGKRNLEDYEVEFVSLQQPFTKAIANLDEQRHRIVSKNRLYEMGSENGEYIGTKWSNHLRAPDIYWKILDECQSKLIRLGDVAEIYRGVTTGCNEFFYLKQSDITEWQIESEYISPVMKSSSESMHTVPKLRDLQTSIFNCDRSKSRLSGTKALEYISWGEEESQGFHLRPSTKNRNRWYSIGSRTSPTIICTCSMNEIYRVFLNQNSVLVDKRLYELYPKGDNLELLFSILNSTITTLMIELGTRTGLGQGLVDMTVYELKQIYVPDPDLFNALPRIEREIGPLSRELAQADRLALDRIILSEIGLNDSDIEEFYRELSKLVDNRLNRSISIT